ncbi:MAG: hypothetical protein ACYTHJ_20945 [Planctomycetota bacterium]
MRTHVAAFAGLVIAIPVASVRADLAPPIKIAMPQDTQAARSGKLFEGQFEIHIGAAGVVSDIEIMGDGWTILDAELPAEGLQAESATLQVPFSAIPEDADRPITLRCRFDGRIVKKSYVVGPAYFSKVGKGHEVVQLTPVKTGSTILDPGDAGAVASGGEILLQFRGRFVYKREDEVFVGADHILVQVMDDDGLAEDKLVDELIWEGYTDENGWFDSGVVSWDDCDATGCDEPDLYVRFECDTPIAQVQEPGLLEEDYWWSTSNAIIEDHIWSPVDFGTVVANWADEDYDPRGAVHVWNSIVRAHRFVEETSGIDVPHVDVQWAEEGGSRYSPAFEEIYITLEDTWDEHAHNHEYGHHFSETQAFNPSDDYCNGYGDEGEECGHEPWCPETMGNAFNEGVSNWFGDVIPRNYPKRYQFDCGSPYKALNPVNYARIGICHEDEQVHDPQVTEGFIAMLLRDIEDDDFSDLDQDPDINNTVLDGVRDLMCLGAGPVLNVIKNNDPHTVLDFINAFRSDYPEHTDLLWSTAFNVGGGAYVADFPNDSALPGVVTSCDSPTHPIGQGGSSHEIVIEFEPAPDDVRGAPFYAFAMSQNAAGTMPVAIPGEVKSAGDCLLSTEIDVSSLGDHYVSIRAQDNFGNWSDQYSVFGPFTVNDCNGTGLIGACDVVCEFFGDPDICSGGNVPCGMAEDCNGNWLPDECDIATGVSEDCNRNGIPDDCEDFLVWIGESGDFNDSDNWNKPFECDPLPTPDDCPEDQFCYAHPVNGSSVCIATESNVYVNYESGAVSLHTLACEENFVLTGEASSPPDLTLQHDSWVDGNFSFAGHTATELSVVETLTVGGTFRWNGPTKLTGPGTTILNGGLLIEFAGPAHLYSELHIAGGSTAVADGLMQLHGGSVLQVDAGSTYRYRGDGTIFNDTGEVRNDGTIVRSSGNETAAFSSTVDNDGLIHNQTGTLYLNVNGTHNGGVTSDPGTTLGFQGVHTFTPSSALTAETVVLQSGNGSVVHGTVNISERIDGTGAIWSFADDATIIDYGNHLYVERGSVEFNAPVDQAIDFETVTITTPGESSGTIYFNTGQPVNVGDFTMITGQLYGSSPINISGEFNWTNGWISYGGAITANGPVTFNPTSSSRTISRVVHINDQATLGAGFGMNTPGRINIADGATVYVQANSGAIGGGVLANNGGTFVRSSGDGDFSISSAIIGDGLFHNQSGTLGFTTHPLNGGSTYTGDIISDPGTALRFAGSGHDLQTSSTLTAETLILSASASTCHGSVDIAESISCEGGSWTFAPDANVLSYGNQLSLNNGNLHIEAPTDRELAFDTVDVTDSSIYFDTGQPVNVNDFVFNFDWIYGTSPINILGTFTWNNGSFWWGPRVTNHGQLTVNPTTSQRDILRHLDNYGMIVLNGGFGLDGTRPLSNMPGGVIDFKNGGIGGGIINNQGTVLKTTDTEVPMPNLNNTGTVDIQSGSFNIHTSYYEYRQTAGETILNDTSIVFFLQYSPFYLEGGSLKGNGEINGDVDNSGGIVSPGFSFGVINVSADYTQGENGMLDIEIGGGLPEEYDLLTVGGTAELAGELRACRKNMTCSP